MLKGTHVGNKIEEFKTIKEFLDHDFEREIKQHLLSEGIPIVNKPVKPVPVVLESVHAYEFLGLQFLDPELPQAIKDLITENIDKVFNYRWTGNEKVLESITGTHYKLGIDGSKYISKEEYKKHEDELKEFIELKKVCDEKMEEYEKFHPKYKQLQTEVYKVKQELRQKESEVLNLQETFTEYLDLSDKSTAETYELFDKHFYAETKLKLSEQCVEVGFKEDYFVEQLLKIAKK